MSCTSSTLLLNPLSRKQFITPVSSYKPQCTKHVPAAPCIQHENQSRRQLLFLLTAATAVTAIEKPSLAEDIGFLGLRKKLKKAEEEAEVIVKEGFEAAEKEIETAEKEIETEVSFELGSGGGLAQAGVVVGAEAVAVLVATSVVNGILGPES